MDAAPTNPELERILSDAARPTRKASKKAMIEMERETQRIAREQALTHKMKVRKKFSTSELFARFNFRQAQAQPLQPLNINPDPSSSSSPAQRSSPGRDHTTNNTREAVVTPPSSPPTPWDTQKAIVEHGALARMIPVREDSIASLASHSDNRLVNELDDLPDIDNIIKQSQAAKAQAVQVAPESPSRSAERKKKFRSVMNRHSAIEIEEDEEELDVLPVIPSHLRMFDRLKSAPAYEKSHSKAIHVLKHLAHLNQDQSASSRKKSAKPFVAPELVNARLLAQARAQGRQAQQERLDELKAKGVIILSAEEQEKEAEQMESLIEKARKEADELRKKEKAAARSLGGDDAVASDDESDDADYEEDDADVDGEVEENVSEDESDRNDLIDTAADESNDSGDSSDEDEDRVVETTVHDTTLDSIAIASENAEEAIDGDIATTGPAVRNRKSHVIRDDEDEEENEDEVNARPASFNEQMSSRAPQSASKDPFAAFGFDKQSQSLHLMSPTQAFNATMQTPTQFTQSMTGRSAKISYFDTPDYTVGLSATTRNAVTEMGTGEDSQSQLVPSSQTVDHTQPVQLDWETQMPETPLPASKTPASMLETPGWEPSQDAGLQSPWTAMRREMRPSQLQVDTEHETQSTVRMRISESPEVIVPRKRGRLTKGVRVQEDSHTELVEQPRNAFAEMQRKRMESLNATERAQAEKEAREMMDEQAEESEDEYAGLGGDDTAMIAPETEEDRAMIDESEQQVDEHAMAKFYAERQRVAEEEATSKLYKDLTTGALRRRQGVGWELDEDEDELAARRRQMRQREEARKRKLLLADENVKDLIEGKGNSKAREAFLRTIGDEDNEEVEMYAEVIKDTPEQSQAASQQMPDQPLQEISANKGPVSDSQERPSKRMRLQYEQTAFTKPTSLLQVRESLSFLLDEPAHLSFGPSFMDEASDENHESGTDSDDDDDDDEEAAEHARENDGGYAPDQTSRRVMPPPPLPTERLPATQRRTPAKPVIIDRLSLRRASSSSGSTDSNGWNAWSTSTQSSKAPSLLRRATSNLSAASANERGITHGKGAATEQARPKTGGSKKSSLAYQARAEERRAISERSEKKRDENRRKLAELRREQGGALRTGAFGASWE